MTWMVSVLGEHFAEQYYDRLVAGLGWKDGADACKVHPADVSKLIALGLNYEQACKFAEKSRADHNLHQVACTEVKARLHAAPKSCIDSEIIVWVDKIVSAVEYEAQLANLRSRIGEEKEKSKNLMRELELLRSTMTISKNLQKENIGLRNTQHEQQKRNESLHHALHASISLNRLLEGAVDNLKSKLGKKVEETNIKDFQSLSANPTRRTLLGIMEVALGSPASLENASNEEVLQPTIWM